MVITGSLSVGWFPPAQKYTPLEDFVKREPNWGYQLFFANPESNQIIDEHVSPLPDSAQMRSGS